MSQNTNCPVNRSKPVYIGYKDFWPLPINSNVKHAGTGEELEAPRTVGDRANTYFSENREICVTDVDYVMYAQIALFGLDQNKDNAPLAVNSGGDDGHRSRLESITNMEVWRYSYETNSLDAYERTMSAHTEYVTGDASTLQISTTSLAVVMLCSVLV